MAMSLVDLEESHRLRSIDTCCFTKKWCMGNSTHIVSLEVCMYLRLRLIDVDIAIGSGEGALEAERTAPTNCRARCSHASLQLTGTA
jgi:hypothetical protein